MTCTLTRRQSPVGSLAARVISVGVLLLFGCPASESPDAPGVATDTAGDVSVFELPPIFVDAIDGVSETEEQDLLLDVTADVADVEVGCVDDDGDGVCNDDDVCPDGDDSLDDDEDGVPDACDACADANDKDDEDEDGVPDACDVCPIGDDNIDTDEDGTPDACDCDEEGDVCHVNAYCVTMDEGVECHCLDGFQGDGVTTCENIDECAADPGPCAANADCTDNYGGFTCSCATGHQGAPYDTGCTPVDCGAPPTITDGSVSTPTGTTYGQPANYACNTCFDTTDTTTLTCAAGGSWSGSAPICGRKSCGAVPLVDDATFVATNDALCESVVTYTCGDCFSMVSGDASRTCQNDRSWSGTAPVCQPVVCGSEPTTVPNAHFTRTDDNNCDSAANYTCDSCYDFRNDEYTSLTCDDEGTWSGTTPICDRVACSDPSVANATYTRSDENYCGSVASFTCNSCYQFTTSSGSSQTCMQNGAWFGTVACDLKSCGDPPTVVHGTPGSDDPVDCGSSVTYTCESSCYTMSGSSTLSCENTAGGTTWSAAPPNCNIESCDTPPTVDFATPDTTDPVDCGSSVTYTCQTGYDETTGDPSVICNDSNVWEAHRPNCAIHDCDTPPHVSHTRVSYPGTTYESTATYHCLEGYSPTGDYPVTCGVSTWEGTTPTCTDVDECVEGTFPCFSDYLYGIPVQASCDDYAGGYECSCPQGSIGTGEDSIGDGWDCEELPDFPPTCDDGVPIALDQYYLGCKRVGVASDTLNSLCPDISSSATAGCPDDDCATTIVPTAFSFDFYGSSWPTTFYFISNGVLNTSESTAWGNVEDLPDYTIAPYWDDLCPRLGASLWYAEDANSMSFQWTVGNYSTPSSYDDFGYDIRVVLHEDTNDITICYVDTFEDTATDFGASATIGIAGSASQQLRHSFFQRRALEGTVLHYHYLPTHSPCSVPSAPLHGSVIVSDSPFYGDIATYSCAIAYTLNGPTSRTCQGNGEWSGVAPTCDGDTVLVEDFETGTWPWTPWIEASFDRVGVVGSGYAHDGSRGIYHEDWFYRTDYTFGSTEGEILSAWARVASNGAANLGFSADDVGTRMLSLLSAAERFEFRIVQSNYTGWTGATWVSQTYDPATWYRFEVEYNGGGEYTGRLYASDGTTLLNTINRDFLTSDEGGIAFDPYYSSMDTIEYTP